MTKILKAKKVNKFLLILLLIMITGCNNPNITTDYDSIQLEITNNLSPGCGNTGLTYYSHNINDKYIYKLDIEDNIEYITNEHWVGYNTKVKQYISSDYGKTFLASAEIYEDVFEKNYSDSLLKLLKIIADSSKEDLGNSKYEVIIDNENELFELLKIFGTINSKEKIESIETIVILDKDNISNIIFNIKSYNEENKMNNCYEVDWTLSNYNSTNVILPKELNDE